MQKNSVTINPRRSRGVINKNIYGHFAEHLGRCIYEGVFVGKDSLIPNVNGMRSDVVDALRRLNIPVLRWPGGCFADEYHWRDGIGAQNQRKRMVNTNWGGVVEDNSFGTHEFLELCRQIGCEPYINANVGSGTVQEMAEWVEYLNSDGDSTVAMQRWENGQKEPFAIKYWGVGNENWGCGGNMRPEYYADVYRRYQTYCRNYGNNKIYRIACGPNTDDYAWTDALMRIAGNHMDALTLHYYTVPLDWSDKGSATQYDEDLFYTTLKKTARMEELISNHLAIMDRYDPEHRVDLIVDEWGCWHNVEPGTNPGFLYQQNTMRDALVAAINLNIFNQHCDRVSMANIAQMVNVLQAVVLTEGDKLVLTPTYHVFDMYSAHMGSALADCFIACDKLQNGLDQLSCSASTKDGTLTITLANLSCSKGAETVLALDGFMATKLEACILTGAFDAYNDFEHPTKLTVRPFEDAKLENGAVHIVMPACAVLTLTLC